MWCELLVHLVKTTMRGSKRPHNYDLCSQWTRLFKILLAINKGEDKQ